MNKTIVVETVVARDIDHVWQMWTLPEHIMNWNFASEDWGCPSASNDPVAGGRFTFRMSARDGSASFDFGGTYTEVIPRRLLAYTMDDGRTVRVNFEEVPEGVRITEIFEMEEMNPEELQRNGWQSILENFRTYAERTG